MKFKSQEKCVLCDSKNFTSLAKTEEYEYKRCENCGLMFVTPVSIMSKEEASEFYENSYYQTCKHMSNFNKENFKLLYPIYEKQFNIFYKYFNKVGNKGRLLDIGCGVGYFLLAAKKMGIECFGIEIANGAAKYGKEVLGINILTEELNKVNFPDNYFDAIRIANVLEHLTDPVGILEEINRVLKKNGVIEVIVPNPLSLVNNLFNVYYVFKRQYKNKKYACSLYNHVHIYSFSPKTIIFLLEKKGFKPFNAKCFGKGSIYAPFIRGNWTRYIISTAIDFIGHIINRGSILCVHALKKE